VGGFKEMGGWVGGGMGGWRERARGECGFNSLVKSKKKRKIALSFTSPEKEFFIYIYDVITWGK
jgi:hypothetical protein